MSTFVRDIQNIQQAKAMINNDVKVISKVEIKVAVDNLIDILNEVEFILADQGNQSTEIGIEKIPAYQ